ncbi:MAG TPA: amino acid ABC transporter ATP-binding protein [Stellaceae bacterium]|nr:amino acid ABC transporter ATP-binding protein [Stellaceae bacterium]
MAEPAVVFSGVDKHFGAHQVLRQVSLAIDEGECVAVIGPSGSGKSTLIRCINGLEPISAGSLTVLGRGVPTLDARGLTRLRGEIGMVFQSFNLYPHLTALQNITLAPRKAKGMAAAEAEALGRRLLERVHLADKAAAYPAQLSGGQQQRVAIARALAMTPRLLLFDEPTSALDPEMIREVLDVIGALAEDGITMAIVTHEMNFARSVADRVVFMDHGAIVEAGPPAQVMEAPRQARTRDFMALIRH